MRTFRSGLGLSVILVVLCAVACGSSGSTTAGTTGSTGAGAGPGTTGGTTGSTTGTVAGTTGTSGATGATGAATTGTAAGSSTGAAINGTTGGTTGGSSTGGAATTGGIAHGMGNDGYCDGLAVEQDNVTDFLIVYPGPADQVYGTDCDPDSYGPDAGSFPQFGGIWAYYSTTSAQGVLPGGATTSASPPLRLMVARSRRRTVP